MKASSPSGSIEDEWGCPSRKKRTGDLPQGHWSQDNITEHHWPILCRGWSMEAPEPLLFLFSCSVISNSLWAHGLLHTRPPCPLPYPGACPSSCPLHWWCHPAISSSVTLFSFCPQSFSASGTFPMSWLLFQLPKISFSFNIRLSNEYSGLISFNIDWFDLLAVQGTLRSLFQHHSSKASILWHSAFFMVQLLQPYVTTGKILAVSIWTFVGRVMSLIFNTLPRFVIDFLPRSNCLLISWLQWFMKGRTFVTSLS